MCFAICFSLKYGLIWILALCIHETRRTVVMIVCFINVFFLWLFGKGFFTDYMFDI